MWAASFQHTVSLQIRPPLCFGAFWGCFFFPFPPRLREQQAVTAPWALTDHSLQPGCSRCSLCSGTLHKGSVGAVQRVSEVAALCEIAPSSVLSVLVTLPKDVCFLKQGFGQKRACMDSWRTDSWRMICDNKSASLVNGLKVLWKYSIFFFLSVAVLGY